MVFTGKTIVVTGGTRGIGLEIVKAFAQRDAFVAVGARHHDGELSALGSNVIFEKTDVRNLTDVQALTETAKKKWGRIDVFVNNAGLSIWRSIDRVDEAFLDRMLATNVKGCLFGCKIAARNLQEGGVIINMGSLAGKRGSANNSVYCASKFAVVGLTQALAKELGPRGIRVNSVCPVYVQTDSLLQNLSGDHPEVGDLDPEKFLAQWAQTNSPLKRLPRASEVADLCVYLASSQASAISGQNINVDCGVLPQ